MYGNSQGLGVVNVAMTNYSKGYTNAALMAFLIAPIVGVDRRSNQYLVFDRANQRVLPTLRKPGGAPVQLSMAYSTDNYVCQAHAAEVPMPRENQATAELLGFQMTKGATDAVMAAVHLRREFEAVSLLKTGVTNIETPSGTDLWDASGTSNPIDQIEDLKYAIKKSGVSANTLLLGPDMLKAARENESIIERFKYAQGGIITLDMLALAFGVPQVKEAAAVAVDGNDTADFLWKGLAVLAYVQPVASQNDLSALKTFVDTTQGVDGYEVLEFPDAHASKKTDYVSGEMAYDMKVTAQGTIGVITGGTQQA